jgi:hypothetical protein
LYASVSAREINTLRFAAKFTGPRSHRVVNAGHNVPQEAPRAFADAVWELASARR